MKRTKLPKTITVTFTKADRETAGEFTNYESCLLCTALKRMGFERPNEQIIGTELSVADKRAYYTHDEFTPQGEMELWRTRSQEKPFYRPYVIGKKIKLTLKTVL